MPASTYEIISASWLQYNDFKKDIKNVCINSNLKCNETSKENLIIQDKNDETRTLNLEFRDQRRVEWYLKKYPMAKDEPIERIPYYKYLIEYPDKQFYSIALANQYLDYELLFNVTKSYLQLNPKQLISINGEKCISLKHFEMIGTYSANWWNKMKNYYTVSNYNV